MAFDDDQAYVDGPGLGWMDAPSDSGLTEEEKEAAAQAAMERTRKRWAQEDRWRAAEYQRARLSPNNRPTVEIPVETMRQLIDRGRP